MHSRARPQQWQELHRETTLFAGQFCHRPGRGSSPRPPTGTPLGRAVTCRPCATTTAGPFPAPLVVAASLAGLEGLLVLAYAVVLAADIHADRAAMGVTTSLFFALLARDADRLRVVRRAHARTWARSPIVVVQVMALGLAWNFLGGDTTGLGAAGRRGGRGPGRPAPSGQHRGALRRHRLASDRAQPVSWSDVRSCGEGPAQQPGHVHLADPDLGRDLRLGLVLEEAEQQDPLLPAAAGPPAAA